MTSAIGEHPEEVRVASLPIGPVRELLDGAEGAELDRCIGRAHELLDGRVVWNVNSTATGGGVAEMLRSLLAYARGAGVETRWLVLNGDDAFFRITKRLHNCLHGDPGDGGPLGAAERQTYAATTARNAERLAAVIRPGDVVILHDPQTAGLVPSLKATGAAAVWRSHVGTESANEHVARGWAFLRPFVAEADAYIFSRREYVPADLPADRVQIIAPSIDPFSAKNQDLPPDVVRAMLLRTGLVAGGKASADPVYRRSDGSTGCIARGCELRGAASPPDVEAPLVVQVSRWDRLKDPLGVMRGFAEHVAPHTGASLVLAGPGVDSVADDPEERQVFAELEEAWRGLPPPARDRVHLACLALGDVEENAAVVNALQRHAAVVVQKSVREGFGLTVSEAMWKARPVVASGVGGIPDQIEDGVSGLLVRDPRDLASFGRLVGQILADRRQAAQVGEQARRRVLRHFLVSRHLAQYFRLLEQLLD